MKYLLDNQIIPDGSDPNPLTCANESYVYAVNRYDVDTKKYSLIYAASRADFPAPEKWTAYSWKLAFDATRKRLYWWYYAGACAVVRTCDAPLYYIDVSGLTNDGDMPTPVSVANVTDGYGHAPRLHTSVSHGNSFGCFGRQGKVLEKFAALERRCPLKGLRLSLRSPPALWTPANETR